MFRRTGYETTMNDSRGDPNYPRHGLKPFFGKSPVLPRSTVGPSSFQVVLYVQTSSEPSRGPGPYGTYAPQ